MKKVIRGYGFLDDFLAQKRAKVAIKLLDKVEQRNNILDIGCGTIPVFLQQVKFSNKYGVDQVISKKINNLEQNKGLNLIYTDLSNFNRLPFSSSFFDAVTMLAVIEHFEKSKVSLVLKEIFRVLKNQGYFIVTTPSKNANLLLNLMSKIGLASKIEVKDHKAVYEKKQLMEILTNVGFISKKVQTDYFEFHLNLWALAIK